MGLILLEDKQTLQLSRSNNILGRDIILDRIMFGLLDGPLRILRRLIEPYALAHCYFSCIFHDGPKSRRRNFDGL
jgi:hypothetical protein